jgi:hypothetical protein
MYHGRNTHEAAAFTLTSLAVSGLVACGDDDASDTTAAAADTTAAATTTVAPVDTIAAAADTTTAPADTTATSGDETTSAAFCDPCFGITEQFNSDAPDPATVTELLGQLEAAIPTELADHGAVLVDSVTTGLGGDMSVFESDEFNEAISAANAWVFEHCAFDTRIDVTAVDWAFGGVPLEVPAGHVAVSRHERGQRDARDAHRAQGRRRDPKLGRDRPDRHRKEDDSALDGIVEEVTHAWIPTSDTAGIAFADLTPGEYVAVCALPVGTNHGMSDEEWQALASPGYEAHWMHGMLQPFTVVEAG